MSVYHPGGNAAMDGYVMTKGSSMKRVLQTAVASIAFVGISFGAASVAHASPTPSDPVHVAPAPGEGGQFHYEAEKTFLENQQRCLTKVIGKRTKSLDKWSADITKRATRSQLTTAQRDELLLVLSTTKNELTTTATAAVNAAVDQTTLEAACASVVTTSRVYKVVHQQVFLTAAAYTWTNRLDALSTRSAALTAKAIVVDSFVKRLARLNTKMADATGRISTVTTGLPAITVTSYNASPKATDKLFREYRRSLERVRGLVKSAEREAKHLENWTPKAPHGPKPH
jgi:hypothetical protein